MIAIFSCVFSRSAVESTNRFLATSESEFQKSSSTWTFTALFGETMLFSFTPLHMVAHQGFDLELMKFMVGNLKKFGYESLDQCLDEYNRHPLHLILKNNGNIEMIKLMIENMKNVNVKATDQMWTPLHVAAMYDNLEAVKLLLANGADPELESSEGGTPITCAEIYGNQEILDCFFKFLGEENPYKASKPLLPMF